MKITEHIHALRVPFQVPVAPGKLIDRFTYVYLVVGREVTVIDSGVRGTSQAVLNYVDGLGFKPGDITRLILTHSHPDHIGSAQSLQESTRCTILAHPAEQAWIEDPQLQACQRPVPGFAQLVEGPVKVDQLLRDGQSVPLDASLSLEVIHTPGHSAGSISLISQADHCVITGDLVLPPGEMPIYDSRRQSVASLEKLIAMTGGMRALLSSLSAPIVGTNGIATHLRDSLANLHHIGQVVTECRSQAAGDAMELCRQVVSKLNLPPFAANPLVARALMAE